jgi:colicin import membrane protein
MASMNSAANPGPGVQGSGVPYTVPPEPSRLPSVLLAVAMHAVLLAFLYIGVNWQNNEPVTVEAEVWDMRVQDAAPAPAPEPPPPPPEPVAKPEPQPQPRPEPVKEVEPPPARPDIALERKKQKELEDKQKRLAEEKRKDELKKDELKKEQEKKLAEKKEQDKKLAEEKKAKELAEKKKEKEKAEKLAKAKEAEEQKRLDMLRAAELARITGAAGSGTAAQSTAPKVDEGYKRAIMQKIKSNTSFLGQAEGNPRVEFKVEQLPTGEIISARMTKSSGNAGFDEAVEKGILKSSPLPKKKDGTVDRTVIVGFKLKDLD